MVSAVISFKTDQGIDHWTDKEADKLAGQDADYPLHEVGRLTLKQNPEDFHMEIEQAGFEPNTFVSGISRCRDRTHPGWKTQSHHLIFEKKQGNGFTNPLAIINVPDARRRGATTEGV